MGPGAAAHAADRRQERFTARGLCPSCGQPSTGLCDPGVDHPVPWLHGGRAAAG